MTAAEARIQAGLISRHAGKLAAEREHIVQVLRRAEAIITARRP